MRTIRTALAGAAFLAALVVAMAVPAAATATLYPVVWAEQDGTPIGGSTDPVTADISGTIGVEAQGRVAECQVTGQVELFNDFANPSGSPATHKILNLEPADSAATSCTGTLWGSPCGVYDVSYGGPWVGSSFATVSNFDLTINTVWCAPPQAGNQLHVQGNVEWASHIDVEVEGNYCFGGFQLDDLPIYADGLHYTEVSGTLALDLDTVEGLSTDEYGPCVVQADYNE